jgi:hypothetical protein
MSSWRDQITEAITDFASVMKVARSPLLSQDITVEFHDAAHKPPKLLPAGKMAIYGFWWNGAWLKVGKAGPQSQARYTSQHYNPASAPSTLAASLLQETDVTLLAEFSRDQPGEWIRTHCCRVNILLPARYGRPILSLFEAFARQIESAVRGLKKLNDGRRVRRSIVLIFFIALSCAALSATSLPFVSLGRCGPACRDHG